MVASSLDVRQVRAVPAPSKPNAPNYLKAQHAQLFQAGMSFSGHERDKLWLNRGAEGFADLSEMSGADSPNDGRAVLATDFDDDGDVDLFVHNIQRERHALWRNDAQLAGGSNAHFLKLRLRTSQSQYEAIGAIVVVTSAQGTTAQVLSRGNGFVSCQAPELIFGLGRAESAEVEVIWPGARKESFGTLAKNTRALLVEGSGKPQTFEERPRPLPDPLPVGVQVALGEPAPKLRLLDAAGQPFAFDVKALARDKPLYLNLWASWCAPCVAEIPVLQELAEQGEVRVAAIGLDLPGDRSKAHALFQDRGGKFDACYLPVEEEGAASALQGLVDLDRLPIPTTLVFSAEGHLQRVIRGPLPRK